MNPKLVKEKLERIFDVMAKEGIVITYDYDHFAIDCLDDDGHPVRYSVLDIESERAWPQPVYELPPLLEYKIRKKEENE